MLVRLTHGTIAKCLGASIVAVLAAACVGSISPGLTTDGSAPNVPSCNADSINRSPCKADYDIAPQLQVSPAPVNEGRLVPHLWILVDEAGEVRATQVHRSGGIGPDVDALTLAKQFTFKPALLNGQAVSAWIYLPVVAPVQTLFCPNMAVPLSAGVATFVDSTALERPELGVVYRYRAMDSRSFDVFIYPHAGAWGSPREQAQSFQQALEIEKQRGQIRSYEIVRNEGLSIRVASGGRSSNISGHVIVSRVTDPQGGLAETFFAVFTQGRSFVKYRATYSPSRSAQAVLNEFVHQIVSARNATPSGCVR